MKRALRAAIWRTAFLLASSILVGGCGGGSGSATYPVSGTVTWNGAPLPDGSIVFMAADDSVAPDAGTIHDGHFAFRAKAGNKKVEIRAVRAVGKVDPTMGVAPRQSYVPAQYNTQTTLTVEVLSGVNGPLAFDLKETVTPLPAKK